jgi:hypothetical protein
MLQLIPGVKIDDVLPLALKDVEKSARRADFIRSIASQSIIASEMSLATIGHVFNHSWRRCPNELRQWKIQAGSANRDPGCLNAWNELSRNPDRTGATVEVWIASVSLVTEK